jgi:hypothetical protein
MKINLATTACVLALTSLATAGHAAKYKKVDVDDGGIIAGNVSAGDVEAEVKTYTISKDTEICGEGTREVAFVRTNDGMLQDAVVFLEKVKEGKAFGEDINKLTLNQEKCEFKPFLGVIANLGELTATNSDPTLHNIHTYEQIGKARRTLMNVSQPNQGDSVTKEVKLRKGNGMKVECDAHDFMHSFVYVAKNPYYSVVDENGHFEIGDIPPGKYDVVVWHGALGEVEAGEIDVPASGEVSLDISY